MQYATEITVNQPNAQLRNIPFVIRDSSGVEVTGETLTGSEIQIAKNVGSFANFAGVVTEIGLGLYSYQATAAECSELGFLDVRIDDGTNPTLHVIVQITAIDIDNASGGVWNAVLENTLTAQQMMRLMTAAAAGELEGADTTNVIIKAANDNSTTRIDATVDSDENRTTVIVTP